MGLKETLFGSKVKQVDMNTPEQKAAIAALNQLAQTGSWGGINLGEGYTGSLGNFDMTGGEQFGLDTLRGLLTSPDMAKARETYTNLADTKFDPSDPSSGYAAYSKALAKSQKQASDVLNREAAIGGSRFSTGILKEKAGLAEDFSNQQGQFLANLFQNSRSTQLAGAQGLQSLTNTQAGLSNQLMNAAALERNLKNQEAQAKFSEWQRARSEKMTQIDLLGTEANRNANIGYTGGESGMLSGLMNSALGAVGTTLGNQAGSWLGGLFGKKTT